MKGFFKAWFSNPLAVGPVEDAEEQLRGKRGALSADGPQVKVTNSVANGLVHFSMAHLFLFMHLLSYFFKTPTAIMMKIFSFNYS